MRECDPRRHLTPGAGAPADPDAPADGPDTPAVPGLAEAPGDMLRAVADFLDDLVEDGGDGRGDDDRGDDRA